MTGTGNSYHAAKQFSGLASDTGYKVSISKTDKLQRKDLKRKEHNGIVVFSYPTHGFCLPWHKLKFIIKFPRGRGRVVLINNRTGLSLKLNPIPGKLVYFSVLWIITIVSTWSFYIVLFWLNRLRIFNHIIAFTTPMRYWRRYIAPGFKGLSK